MTSSQPQNHDKQSRYWILQTLGLAFGLAVSLVAIVTVAVLAIESPANQRAAVRAAPLSTAASVDAAPGAALEQVVVEAPTSTAEPTQTPTELPPTATQSPTRTPLPTATATRLSTPLPTATMRSVVTPRTAAPKSSVSVQRLPAATATPIRALDFSFYVKARCATASTQTLQVVITGHGGHPPYDYYNDTTLLAEKEAGSARYTFDASAGNPVPMKLIVVDSTGQRFVQTMFYKTGLKCGH
ncbi:MAG: hypothetical protein HY870_16900 [Chloroflexi bacterium]|nr:hypothetical protein [Chloroflexota bacterium]